MDGRLWLYATCILCGVSVSYTWQPDSRVNKDCQKLEYALVKFVKTCKTRNYLLNVMDLPRPVNRRTIDNLGAYIGLDLHSPNDVKKLAQKLCHSRSRAFLSYTLRVDILQVDQFYEYYILPVKTYGRLRSFKKVGQIAIELLEWTLQTGYPVAPLQHAGRRETEKFLEHVQEELTSDPRVRIALREELFPLAYEPAFVAKVLTEADSLKELSDRLQIPEVWLRAFAKDMRPRRIARHIRGVRAALRLYRVAEKLGLLDLQ